MALRLGTGLALARGGLGGLALGRVLDLDMATGRDYLRLSINSTSTTGLVKGHDGIWVPKPATYLASLEGARVNGSLPVWDDGSGNALSGVIWRGPAPAATNLCLHSRDLTNAAWTKTNATAAKTATGIDGVANSASTLTATAGNGTCLQSITSASSTRRQSAFVKRRTGSGVVEMTQDGGTTWTSVTVTASWARVDIPVQTLTNPSIGFRIVTSGDAIDVDVAQQETGTAVTPPIPTTTTTAARTAETVRVPFTWLRDWTLFIELGDEHTPDYAGKRIFDTTTGSTPMRFASSTEIGSSDGVLVSFGAGSVPAGNPTRLTLKRSGTAIRLFNGSSFVNGDAVFTPAETSLLDIGSANGAIVCPRNINKIMAWTRALSDEEMQLITA